MVRNVKCLADVLLMIAESDSLVSLVHEKGFEGCGVAMLRRV